MVEIRNCPNPNYTRKDNMRIARFIGENKKVFLLTSASWYEWALPLGITFCGHRSPCWGFTLVVRVLCFVAEIHYINLVPVF
jgi:hypothetical protein